MTTQRFRDLEKRVEKLEKLLLPPEKCPKCDSLNVGSNEGGFEVEDPWRQCRDCLHQYDPPDRYGSFDKS